MAAFPSKLFCRMRVSLLSLYGMCVVWFSVSLKMTWPSVSKLLLMKPVSYSNQMQTISHNRTAQQSMQ